MPVNPEKTATKGQIEALFFYALFSPARENFRVNLLNRDTIAVAMDAYNSDDTFPDSSIFPAGSFSPEYRMKNTLLSETQKQKILSMDSRVFEHFDLASSTWENINKLRLATTLCAATTIVRW